MPGADDMLGKDHCESSDPTVLKPTGEEGCKSLAMMIMGVVSVLHLHLKNMINKAQLAGSKLAIQELIICA